MKLGELAFSCYIFNKIDKGTYKKFRKEVDPLKYVKNDDYLKLLKLLNKYWNCRLPDSSLESLAKKLESWHKEYRAHLFRTEKVLSKLDDNDLSFAAKAYGDILNCRTKYKTKNKKNRHISLGPTVASKILFALRPNALPPWDKSIRDTLVREGVISGYSPHELYLSYLKHTQNVIHDLQETYGQTLQQWLREIGKSLPKLIDEYYWITKTRKINPPTKDVLQCWVKWYG
ncbi:MAG: hypothetical protein U9Q07_06070 [Planctomycetota bacterium]|nr:hypothetical protein [Planctomycetota bacterium]